MSIKNENEIGDKTRLYELIKSSLELFGLDQQLGDNYVIYEHSSVIFGRNSNVLGWKGDGGGPR